MKRIVVLLICLSLLILTACAGHIHTIGSGPSSGNRMEARQWYVLWGLIPINQIDTKAMAAGATNYEIRTEAAPLDIIINLFTSYITVTSRTVSVTK